MYPTDGTSAKTSHGSQGGSCVESVVCGPQFWPFHHVIPTFVLGLSAIHEREHMSTQSPVKPNNVLRVTSLCIASLWEDKQDESSPDANSQRSFSLFMVIWKMQYVTSLMVVGNSHSCSWIHVMCVLFYPQFLFQ